ncbi:MAG: MG2 domain-containing protein, partial [bacterium]|nr:MG2 domain-containing protein [bacterium]
FNVTDLGCVILGGAGAGYVWSAWLDDGTPAANAKVELWAEEEASPWYQELAREGTTDSDGWVEFSTPERSLEYPVSVAEKDGNYAVADTYEFTTLTGMQPTGYLVTDRTLYKPGDTVNWELMLRREIEPSGQIYGYEQVKNFRLQIQATAGDTLYEGEVVTDSRGRAGGSFDIPEDAQLGYIYFYAYYTDADEYQYSVCYSYLRLEEYKKPEFDVTVSLQEGPLRMGGEAQATVTATYLYGEPVGAGVVLYTVTRTPRWWMPEIADADKETMPAWFEDAGYDYDYYWWGWYSPTQVYTGRMELGRDGTAKFPVMLVPPEGDENQQFWDYGWYTYYYDFALSLTVSDSSGRAVDGSARTNAARHLYMPTITLDADTVLTGEDVTGNFSLIDLFKEPAAGVPVTITLNPVPENYYNWDTQNLQGYLKGDSGVTGEDGAFAFTLGTAGIDIGSYILVADFEDPWSGQRQHFAWAYISEKPVEPEEITPYLTLAAEKDFYAVGDTARVTIGWNKSTVRGILLVESGGLVRDTIPVTIREGETSQVIKLDGVNAPLTTLRLLTFFERTQYTASIAVPMVPEEKVLAVGIEPSRVSYAPGEKATLNLTVTDSDGRAVSDARLTVTVFDTALYVLGADKHVDVRNFFFKNFNYGYLYQASSADYWTYYDFFDYWASPAGALPHGWMISQLGLASTEMDKLSEITTADHAMYADGGGAGYATGAMEAESAVSPMARAEDLKAGDEGFGGGGAAGLIEELAGQIREEFKDTAYWQTQIKTDSRGRATVSFDLPDDLTGWQVVVWAFEEDRVGQDETVFRTVLPVVARLQYPRYLTERDETTLTLNVGNYTAKAATGQAGLVAEAEGAVEMLTPDL